MHENEFHIDEALVHQLISKQFPQWAHLPLKPVPSTGTDNALYRLGSDMLVRLPRIDWAIEDIDKEFEWLPKIAPFLPVPISTPIAKGTPTQDYRCPWSVYSWLEGSNPIASDLSESFIHDLIGFIQALHRINLPHGPISNRGVPLKGRDVETRKAIQELEGMIDTPSVVRLWEKALKVPQWSKPPVWIHGDLSSGNVLIKNSRLSGVIDFGNLGVGDPACDLMIAWNLLPSNMRQIFLTGLGIDVATWERGRGWALSVALIQLPYYKDTNPTLADNARHVIQEIRKEDILTC